jgi:hypothetical protein
MDYKISNIADEILIIENVIPKSFQDGIIDKLQGENYFPWFTIHRVGNPLAFPRGTTPVYPDKNITDDVGLYHLAFDSEPKSVHFDFFRMVLEFFSEKTGIKIGKLMRIRLRYTHPSIAHDDTKYAAPHVDFSTSAPYSTLVYYVDDSDGDTILFDKMYETSQGPFNPLFEEPLTELLRVTPKKGVGLFFNGHRYHAGNYPIKYSTRIVINFDFETL